MYWREGISISLSDRPASLQIMPNAVSIALCRAAVQRVVIQSALYA